MYYGSVALHVQIFYIYISTSNAIIYLVLNCTLHTITSSLQRNVCKCAVSVVVVVVVCMAMRVFSSAAGAHFHGNLLADAFC